MTELAKYLNELMPSIVTGLSIATFLICTGILAFRKAKNIVSSFTDSKQRYDLTTKDIKKIIDNENRLVSIEDKIGQVENKIELLAEMLLKLIEAEKLVYSNDVKGVSNGVAGEIIKVLNNEKDKK